MFDGDGAFLGLRGDESDAGDVITSLAGAEDGFDGDSWSSGRGLANFCDDFRGGGLGGNGESLFFFFSLDLASPFTVEFEDDDVSDSRSDGRP